MARRLLELPIRMPRNVRHRSRAFTLIELMVVVAIVGVLSVIAVLGYRRLILSSKLTEGVHMVSAIRIAQEDYLMSNHVYADIGSANHCPRSGLDVPLIKTFWDNTCSGGTKTWVNLQVHTDGPVQFGYMTYGTGAPSGYGFVNIASLNTAPGTWYVIHAQADLDGNAVAGQITELVATSQGNQIFTHNDGQ